MNLRSEIYLNRLVKWLVMLGFLCLPYTHFNWMPDLGTTRPLSAVFFALAFLLVVFQGMAANGRSLKKWLQWPRSWDNWLVLRWWVWLIILGALSAAITPLYGLPVQALTRLLGYIAIFITLFMAFYSLPRYGIKTIARWTVWGYLPVLVYALIEVLAIKGLPWAGQFILSFRSQFLVSFPWGPRLALLTTEPSFVGFQVLLLAFLLPYITEKWLSWCGWVLVALCLLFTSSGTLLMLAVVYLGLWLLFSLRRRDLIRLTAVASGLSLVTLVVNWLVPRVQPLVNTLVFKAYEVSRLPGMSVSIQIRLHYILNLVYAIFESYGLGLGIGQYGYFWKDIYLRHFDYTRFDPTGEVARTLFTPGDYMKPWSVLLGIGVDLGVLGLALLVGFLWQVYRFLSEPRHRALFFACLVGLAGAYPIVTPHIWLVLALMAGMGSESKKVVIAA
jgi:hypothetical protein